MREEEGEARVGGGCRLRILAAVDGEGRALFGARLRNRALQWQRSGGLGGENAACTCKLENQYAIDAAIVMMPDSKEVAEKQSAKDNKSEAAVADDMDPVV
ncbi:ABC transporter ATP-binding protein [Sesbania bispinosa]|nr:ABC transporter ATP-binding protein [Sesbania bispinosa]